MLGSEQAILRAVEKIGNLANVDLHHPLSNKSLLLRGQASVSNFIGPHEILCHLIHIGLGAVVPPFGHLL